VRRSIELIANNTLVTRAQEIQLPVIHRSFPIVTSEPSPAISQPNILQLVLIHPEIVAQFMDDRPADLFADSGLAGADRFNILLIKHDVIGPRRPVKHALLGRGHAMEETQEQPPLLPRLR